MTKQDFDRLLDSIREDGGTTEQAREAAARVRGHLEGGSELSAARLESCGDFRTLFPGYRVGTLTEARRMLVEDHLHTLSEESGLTAARPLQVSPLVLRVGIIFSQAPLWHCTECSKFKWMPVYNLFIS